MEAISMVNYNTYPLTPYQQNYFKNSKAVDEDGNLLILFHGTRNVFTTFDKAYQKKESIFGPGFYFSEFPASTTHYGPKKPFHLNVKNPLTFG